jgi:hypothetical protein
MDYNSLFTKFFSDLKGNAGIKVVTEDFYLKEQVLPEFIEKYPFLKSMPDELRVLNDNTCYWECQAGNEFYPMGEFHFISIEQIVADNADLKQFDDHPQGGDGVAACIKFSNGNHEVWLLNENGEQFRMNLDLPGYFTELANLKAIYGWQYLFTDVAWKQLHYSVVKKDLKERLSKLKTLFPDFDIAKYNKMIL